MRLSQKERERRAALARRVLVPGAIKRAGKKGFYRTATSLAKNEGVTNPVALAGWLKGQAKRGGQLVSEHAYRGRTKAKGEKVARLRALFARAVGK
ncbi:MAG: hypothetical protein QMD08_08205 [Actinomycetota bacterium]|nr:hypothetical protein [Actinomycetota bacterium]